jgi:WD40 repeat protein
MRSIASRQVFRGPIVLDESLSSISFSLNGRILASGVYSAFDYMIRLWDLKTGAESTLFGHSRLGGKRCAVVFSPAGRTLASGKHKTIRLWDVASEIVTVVGEIATLELSDTVNSVAFSPDGRTLASGGDTREVKFWNVDTGKQLCVIDDHSPRINTVAFSPGGQVLASGGRGPKITISDPRNRREICTLAEHTREVTEVTFSPDGRTLASGGKDGTIKIRHRTSLHPGTGTCQGPAQTAVS